MELNDFIAYVETGALLESKEVHQFMHQMGDEELSHTGGNTPVAFTTIRL